MEANANLAGVWWSLGVRDGGIHRAQYVCAGCKLKDQRTVYIVAFFGSVMFDAMVPVGAKVVETQTVGIWIDDVEKFGFEGNELRWINLALEN